MQFKTAIRLIQIFIFVTGIISRPSGEINARNTYLKLYEILVRQQRDTDMNDGGKRTTETVEWKLNNN